MASISDGITSMSGMSAMAFRKSLASRTGFNHVGDDRQIAISTSGEKFLKAVAAFEVSCGTQRRAQKDGLCSTKNAFQRGIGCVPHWVYTGCELLGGFDRDNAIDSEVIDKLAAKGHFVFVAFDRAYADRPRRQRSQSEVRDERLAFSSRYTGRL